MNTADQIHISIVIVSYNVKDLVLQSLKTLYNFLPENISIETILVDNQSVDNTVNEVSNKFPQVIIIANEYNAGFPAANNQAFKIAKGKYIFMLNPDTEFVDDSLSKMYNYIQLNTDVNILAPMLLNTDDSKQLNVWRYPTFWDVFYETHYLNFLLGKKNYKDKNLDESFEAESFSGAAILFKKDTLSKIGMLDETMFWIEDIDFCYRAKREGLKLMYYPEAKVKHHIGQSAKSN
jgi:N-acetylglucosaminyl-diphospho-decaprenol L-rhamnosyltransferase